MVNTNKLPEENEEKYLWRLGQAKDNGLLEITWNDIADLMNKNCLNDVESYKAEAAWRKAYQQAKRFFEAGVFSGLSCDQNLRVQKEELEKERVKTRDERTEYRRLLREEARKESMMERLEHLIKTHVCTPLQYEKVAKFSGVLKSDSDLIVPLFDIHAGMESNNYWNVFNKDVLKHRLNKYLDKICEVQLRNGCENAYVVISEATSGFIHPTLRIENAQDAIDQFLTVTDYLSDFLTALSYRFNEVHVYVAPGNHGRMMPNKEESIDHENTDNLLVPFFEAKLQNFKNVHCHRNTIEQSIAMFNVRGKNVFSSHGDKESLENAVQKLTMFLGVKPDIYICGHRHTNAMRTEYDTKCIQNGSISGSDTYCMDKRLRGKPEQMLCVVNDDGLDCIYDVKF